MCFHPARQPHHDDQTAERGRAISGHLHDVSAKLPAQHVPENRQENASFEYAKYTVSVIKLPLAPDITGLFLPMTPYFDSAIKPSAEMMNLKLIEGVYY
jgi:hypothetical protein